MDALALRLSIEVPQIGAIVCCAVVSRRRLGLATSTQACRLIDRFGSLVTWQGVSSIFLGQTHFDRFQIEVLRGRSIGPFGQAVGLCGSQLTRQWAQVLRALETIVNFEGDDALRTR
jgi:hypothetical protein